MSVGDNIHPSHSAPVAQTVTAIWLDPEAVVEGEGGVNLNHDIHHYVRKDTYNG